MKAKEYAGLVTELTGAMGRRTKYQREDYAQLIVCASSTLAKHAASTSSNALSGNDFKQDCEPTKSNVRESTSSEWQHGQYELGKRLVVADPTNGEEAAVREVLLDSIDGGPCENIILEGGPHLTASESVDKGGALHPLDQAILLALCIDVSNSNPVDGLTTEEMQPYVERVLELATNWMIHSTALLERSWIEFERRKTMDRAMLQIQALIDQHTTKLTMMQSTFQSIAESAPVEERLRYIYSIVYPSTCELKKDLAFRYLRCQVFMSALNYFKELELWDEVVTCYQLMQKPQRAELVVREQLKLSETPYMITALADLTGNESLYEKAWLLSSGRYPRAKRTLAKIFYDRGDYAGCISHLDAALAVQPLISHSWYLKGIACMRLERWSEGVESFVRCVQQDMEIGEAWANMGAIHMRERQWSKAHHALTEALKHKRQDWRVLENLMTVSLAMRKWKEAMRHMDALIDLRHKSQRPVHVDELRHLVKVILTAAQVTTNLTSDGEERSAVAASEENDDVLVSKTILLQLENLLKKITGAVKSDPAVWDVYSQFASGIGNPSLVLDCRLKEFRAVINENNWETDADRLSSATKVARSLMIAMGHEVKGRS